MRDAPTDCLTTQPPKRGDPQNGRRTGVSRDNHVPTDNLNDNLLKFRAVLILMAAPRGAKRATAATLSDELKRYGMKAAISSLYNWRRRYLGDGFAGIARRRRSDRFRYHFSEDLLASIFEIAGRRRVGNISREYSRLNPAVSYETFRMWVRRLQRLYRSGGQRK
jgi:hypothetical protein